MYSTVLTCPWIADRFDGTLRAVRPTSPLAFARAAFVQGMNAAVRAVTRIALESGRVTTVYAVWNGYEGLVEGGDAIRPIHWADVGGILQEVRRAHLPLSRVCALTRSRWWRRCVHRGCCSGDRIVSNGGTGRNLPWHCALAGIPHSRGSIEGRHVRRALGAESVAACAH